MSAHDERLPLGLPERLPEGERILWQGRPEWRGLARDALHVRVVAGYFLCLAAWSAATAGTRGVSAALEASLPAGALGLAAISLLALFAVLAARTSMYTITDRRVVLSVGVALHKAVNLPFAQISAAHLKDRPGDLGEIALELTPDARIGYATLWPHVRPWRLARPQPSLRAIAEAGAAAEILAHALHAAHGQSRPAVAASPPSLEAPQGAPAPAWSA